MDNFDNKEVEKAIDILARLVAKNAVHDSERENYEPPEPPETAKKKATP
jgi:hypothetical protein